MLLLELIIIKKKQVNINKTELENKISKENKIKII